ncbi:hypothetical protein D3C76_1734590 [compost metagenome]
MQRLRDHYKQIIPKIVFAKSEEEAKKFIEEAKTESVKLGYPEILEWKTAKWQENLKIMGRK